MYAHYSEAAGWWPTRPSHPPPHKRLQLGGAQLPYWARWSGAVAPPLTGHSTGCWQLSLLQGVCFVAVSRHCLRMYVLDDGREWLRWLTRGTPALALAMAGERCLQSLGVASLRECRMCTIVSNSLVTDASIGTELGVFWLERGAR